MDGRIGVIAGLLCVSAAWAQSPPPPASPLALPGDRMPPADPWAPKPPAGAAPAPRPEPQSVAASPSLAEAQSAAQAALANCLADGFKVGVAVVDVSGQPRVTMVADGSLGGHAYTGVRKALLALAASAPTSEAAARMAADPSARAMLTPAMMPWAGAVPLWRGGQVVGAIGVSGASSAQDERCAAAGAAAIHAAR